VVDDGGGRRKTGLHWARCRMEGEEEVRGDVVLISAAQQQTRDDDDDD